MRPLTPGVQKLAYAIPEAVEATGLGRTTIYEDIKAGVLKARKRGSRTIIEVAEIERYISSLPEA